MATIHPFDFEACELPSKSVEYLLGIESTNIEVSNSFFQERFGLQFENTYAVDLNKTLTQLNPAQSLVNKTENKLPSGSKKLTSHIASISTFDLLRAPHFSHSNSSLSRSNDDNDGAPKAISQDADDDKRKVTDKWGFVVEDPTELANSTSRGNSRYQNKLEDKWLDILKDWASYSEEKKRRIFKKYFYIFCFNTLGNFFYLFWAIYCFYLF